jgi:hypothetical protein
MFNGPVQNVIYNEAGYDAPRDDRLIYQDIRERDYGNHLPIWATTLRSKKVCDPVCRLSVLEVADFCYVAVLVRK